MWKEFNCVAVANIPSAGEIALNTAVVVYRRPYIPTNFTIELPSCSFSGLMNATIFVPGGAKGVAVKLNSPNTYAWADNLGFVLEDRKRFIVIFVCGISLSHSESGKFGSAPANAAL